MIFCAPRRWGKRGNGNSTYCAVARLRGCAVADIAPNVGNSNISREENFLEPSGACQILFEFILSQLVSSRGRKVVFPV
jgi:hypothetical protein